MTDYRVGIVDIGMGNLRSVANAVYENGHDPEIIQDPSDFIDLPRLILPGVGNFKTASDRLFRQGWVEPIQKFAKSRKPVLGICLGMQLLASHGEEGGGSSGLNLIPGNVSFISRQNVRVPHVGWNNVDCSWEHPVFENVKPGRDFYFVHSYEFSVDSLETRLAVTDYNGEITAVVAKNNVLGMQFHPEKSQRNGLALLESFLEWDGNL